MTPPKKKDYENTPMRGSPQRKKQLSEARAKKNKNREVLKARVEADRYTMSEGLGETQARRFLSKLDIKPPDKKKKHFIGHRKTRANN